MAQPSWWRPNRARRSRIERATLVSSWCSSYADRTRLASRVEWRIMPQPRIVHITVRSRAAAAALGVAALVAGRVLLAFGLPLVASASMVGGARERRLLLYPL